MKRILAIIAAPIAGGIIVMTVPASATTTPAKPAWLHIGHVHRYRDCHGPGVRVWQTGGNTSALHCKNGKTFLS